MSALRVRFDAWSASVKSRRFLAHMAFTTVFLSSASIGFSRFVTANEANSGPRFVDPVLEALPLVDVTWPIFVVLYASLVWTIWNLQKSPPRFLIALNTWAGMCVMRTITLWLTPIDPPADCITLVDPFTLLIFGTSQAPVRDLFFSGHTATMFILILVAETKRARAILIVAMCFVASCVLLMRAHYTIDVFCAPFMVAPIYALARRFGGLRE